MAKKKNPQDATLRNVRASNKALLLLRRRVKVLETLVDDLVEWVAAQSKVSSDVSE